MKKLFAVGAITLMVSMSAFGQTPETKTPPKKKPAGSASQDTNKNLVTPGNKVSVDPQPASTTIQSGGGSVGGKVSINPQPLPPRQQRGVTSAGSKVSLNPQPLPPKTATTTGAASAGSKVSLNPQPLPPKQNVGAAAGQAKQ